MHNECLTQWFRTQKDKKLWPTCPYCRADPPASVLHQLGEYPSSSPPLRWEAARRHAEFLHHSWDDSIPFERDSFFLEFLNISLPSNVFFFYQTVSDLYLTTIRRYENRRVSRFLAQTKRGAIRRFRFELANLLDY